MLAPAVFSAQPTQIETGAAASAVAVADMDGDGAADLVSVSSSGKLTVQLNGDLSQLRTFPLPVGASALAVGDAGGDSRPDVVTANGTSISVLIQGNGGYTITTVPMPANTTASSVAIGDLNADGHADVGVLDIPDHELITELRGSNGSFAPTTYQLAPNTRAIAIADLDGDGLDDIAVAEPTGLDLLHQKRTVGFIPEPLTLPAGAMTPSAVAIGDLDGDGDLDLAVADSGASSVYVFTKGDAGYTATIAGATGATPNAIAIGDLDDDGTPDLVTGNAQGVTALLRSGATYVPTTIAAPSPGAIGLGDIDRDARPDIVTSTGTSKVNVLVNTTPTPATVTLGAGARQTSFGTTVNFAATVTPKDAGAVPTGTITFTVDGLTFPPAPLVDGTANLGARALSAGPHTVTATYADDAAMRYFAAPASYVHVVGIAHVMDGDVSGPLTITEPTLISNAVITGDVLIQSHGALELEHSTITGNVDAEDADALLICDSTLDGDLTVHATGHVEVGDDATGCAGNRIGGTFTATQNGGVTAIGNAVAQLALGANPGFGPFNMAAPVVSGNTSAPRVALPGGGARLPDTLLGATSTGTIDVLNTGAGALHVSGVTATDPAYSVTDDTCTGVEVAPGGRCEVTVRFAPATAGAHPATLRIASDTASRLATLPLTGTALRPGTASLSATSLTFPDTPVGTTATARTLTVTNAGDAPLPLSGDSITGDFQIVRDGCGSATLAPGDSCSLDVVFKPGTGGAASGTLRIASASVGLSGTGLTPQVAPQVVPRVQSPAAPAASRFAVAAKAGRKGAITLTLTLPGAGRYTITSPLTARRTGTAAGARTVTVKLAPSAAGKRALKKAKKLKVKLTVAFTPAGGKAAKLTQTVTVKR